MCASPFDNLDEKPYSTTHIVVLATVFVSSRVKRPDDHAIVGGFMTKFALLMLVMIINVAQTCTLIINI